LGCYKNGGEKRNPIGFSFISLLLYLTTVPSQYFCIDSGGRLIMYNDLQECKRTDFDIQYIRTEIYRTVILCFVLHGCETWSQIEDGT
jgi:hypothetical protein